MLPSVIPKLATDSAVRVFPVVWKLLSFLRLPTSFVSLVIFYIFSYLLLKTMGCFSGCLMTSASIQKLFCGIYSVFKCSFDEFVGEKVVSPSYSSAILGPPHTLCNLKRNTKPSGFWIFYLGSNFIQSKLFEVISCFYLYSLAKWSDLVFYAHMFAFICLLFIISMNFLFPTVFPLCLAK